MKTYPSQGWIAPLPPPHPPLLIMITIWRFAVNELGHKWPEGAGEGRLRVQIGCINISLSPGPLPNWREDCVAICDSLCPPATCQIQIAFRIQLAD